MPANELILLVNDIPDHLAGYRRGLIEAGFRVEMASSGTAALDQATVEPPDLVVVDVRLPDMTGWELCKAIKKASSDGQLPVIMLTPELTKASAVESASVGCNAWLAHPARAEDLVRAVRQVLAAEAPAPESLDAALLGITECPACGADAIRPTLRMSFIQYYACRACGLRWRVDTTPA